MTEKNNILSKIYFDPRDPGSLGGINKLLKSAKKIDHSIKIKDVKEFLSTVDAYTLHRDKRRRFPRNRYILKGIDDLWQADLADLVSIAGSNQGYKYLLVVIDCFSKFLWVEAIKSKTALDVLDALKLILQRSSPRKPKNWQVDKGTEFQNVKMKDFMRNKGINFYKTQNPDTKAAFAERVIRTLKGRIYRYMANKNGKTYINQLQEIVDGYNSSKHRSTGTAPTRVTETNSRTILRKMYPDVIASRIKFKFNVGDTVRVAKERQAFDKGYHPGWTEEIFTITQQLGRKPPVYKLKDAAGEEIEGTFYEPEIQKVKKIDDYYKVEKVLKTRKIGNKVEYLIKWLGYPVNMSTWEPRENFKLI